MAEKRMFTKKVTDDDNFMELSSSAQALYLHLNMAADDDGFCNQVSISMFKAHATSNDLKSLIDKKYIYQFDNGVICIKHWRMANALRKDRHTPTAFREELHSLVIKDNGSYTLASDDCQVDANRLPSGCQNGDTWLPSGCRVDAERLPQDRGEENRLDKINSIYLSDRADDNLPLDCDDRYAIKPLNGKLGQGYVMMSDAQFDDLCEKLSAEEIDKYISVVRDCEKAGKHYSRTHYQAILDMAKKDRRVNT